MREYCERSGIVDFVIFSDENQSGAKSSRPALDSMMNSIREGECSKVVVYSFSRYARSVGHLLKALEEFRKLEVDFVSVTEQIDTNSTMGRAFFGLIAVMAQLERELIIERVRNGLANAKAKGVRLGREKKRDSHLIRSLRLSGLTYREIGKIAKCSSGCVAAEIRDMKREGLLDEKGVPVIQRLGDEPGKSKQATETPAAGFSKTQEEKLELVRF
jgi:DNA invertase Pin-like site-specific DNA recombinase